MYQCFRFSSIVRYQAISPLDNSPRTIPLVKFLLDSSLPDNSYPSPNPSPSPDSDPNPEPNPDPNRGWECFRRSKSNQHFIQRFFESCWMMKFWTILINMFLNNFLRKIFFSSQILFSNHCHTSFNMQINLRHEHGFFMPYFL